MSKRVGFAMFVAWFLMTLAMIAESAFYFGEHGHDFRSFYSAAHVFLAGGDPYDFAQVARVLEEISGAPGNFAFYHPPWFAVLMAPLALLPYPVARIGWLLLNVGAWFGSLVLLLRLLQWRAAAWLQQLMFLGCTYLFALFTWRFEQLGVLLLFFLVVALWLISRGHNRWAGVCLALLLTKPTVGATIAAGLLLWLIRQGRWRALQGFGAMLGVLLLVSFPLLPTYLDHLLYDPTFGQGLSYELDGPGNIVGVRIDSTMRAWLLSLGAPPPLAILLHLVGAIVALFIVVRVALRTASPLVAGGTATLATFWVAPYVLQYDYPLMVLPFLMGLQVIMDRQAIGPVRLLVASAFLLGVLGVPVWEGPISDGFWIVLGLSTLFALLAPSFAQGVLHEAGSGPIIDLAYTWGQAQNAASLMGEGVRSGLAEAAPLSGQEARERVVQIAQRCTDPVLARLLLEAVRASDKERL